MASFDTAYTEAEDNLTKIIEELADAKGCMQVLSLDADGATDVFAQNEVEDAHAYLQGISTDADRVDNALGRILDPVLSFMESMLVNLYKLHQTTPA